MSAEQSSNSVYRFAVLTAICTVLLLMAGALVTSNNAAESVPDWPLAYGKLIPPMIGGIRFEYAHRVMAALVSILTFILAICITAKESRPLARRLGWTALALVIAQAVSRRNSRAGRLSGDFGYGPRHSRPDFLPPIVGLALYLSPWWQRDLPQYDDSNRASVRYARRCGRPL